MEIPAYLEESSAKHLAKFFFVVLLVFTLGCSSDNFTPQKNTKIIFLGNTFADRMQYYGYFETILQKRFPGHTLSIRNMGWSADEPALQPRPLNFGNLHHHLTQEKADIIFLYFGMNESFKGEQGLSKFEKEFKVLLKELQSHHYNGKNSPQIVIISPVAHEDLGGYLPNPTEHNQNLKLYTSSLSRIAKEHNLPFIDLFKSTFQLMETNKGEPFTINGIHLNGKGYRVVSELMAKHLGLIEKNKSFNFSSQDIERLRQVIIMKNQHFFYRWRAVNGEYIYGRRKNPFGVKTFPPEFEKLKHMTSQLDTMIWRMSQEYKSSDYQEALAIVDQTPESIPYHRLKIKKQPISTDQFIMEDGYEISLFASEQDFPLENSVSMTFDPQGRLWVATMPNYPHYLPGLPPDDKIIILEDTNGDGKADKHTVFADHLYLPLGFELGDGGVYVSQEPNLVFLKDTTGDDKADIKQIILHGFGTEDSHHAISAFTWGPDGALYFHEGRFLHTQVETPYGPVRGFDGATYRYEPRTQKLSNYISYNYHNPWGNVFNRWGVHLINDASDGANYYATPMTGKINYPLQHPEIDMFTTTRVRPTAGAEIVSSRHFPESAQGNFLVNNTIGFQGIKQHKIIPKGSGFTAKEVEPLLQSTDPNFRPVDLQFGPDGALYVVDWFNPLIGHMQHSFRDSRRDHSHGRIWRITYKNKPLVTSVDVSKQDLSQLLDNLKVYEDRFRYRTRIQLREFEPKKVISGLKLWINNLDTAHSQYEHYLLEALWVYQQFDVVEEDLLDVLLNAKNPKARAAATRVLFYWRDRIENPLALLKAQINDSSPRVRIEAAVALSYFEEDNAVDILLDVLQYPRDYYLQYAIDETAKHLKPLWLNKFHEQKEFLAGKPHLVDYLLNFATTEEILNLPRHDIIHSSIIRHGKINTEERLKSLFAYAENHQINAIDVLIKNLILCEKQRKEGFNNLVQVMMNWDKTELLRHKQKLKDLIDPSYPKPIREVGYAALITAEGSDQSAWNFAIKGEQELVDFLDGIKLISDANLRGSLYPKVKMLISDVPSEIKKETKSRSPHNFWRIHASAIKAVGCIPGNVKEKIKIIGSFIKPEDPYLAPSVEILLATPDTDFSATNASLIVQNIISMVSTTPEATRKEPVFDELISLGEKLAPLLPADEAADAKFLLESTGTFEVEIMALVAEMAFNQKEITIPAGRPVEIIFSNPDGMPHNLVIIKIGALEKVGKAADAMAKENDGFEKQFVPDIPEVLFATPLINSGEEYSLMFTAPKNPGNYPFACTFPGHWLTMNGILKVVSPLAAINKY